MTVVGYTTEAIDNGIVVTWAGLAPGDEGEPFDVSQYPMRTLQAKCNVVTPTHPVTIPLCKLMANLDVSTPWKQVTAFNPQTTNNTSHMSADVSRTPPELRYMKPTVPATPTSPTQSFPEGWLGTVTLMLLKS